MHLLGTTGERSFGGAKLVPVRASVTQPAVGLQTDAHFGDFDDDDDYAKMSLCAAADDVTNTLDDGLDEQLMECCDQ